MFPINYLQPARFVQFHYQYNQKFFLKLSCSGDTLFHLHKSEAKIRVLNVVKVKTEVGGGNASKSQEDFNRLKNDYEEALANLEAKYEQIEKLESFLKMSDEKLSKLEPLEEQFHQILEKNKILNFRHNTMKKENKEVAEACKIKPLKNFSTKLEILILKTQKFKPTEIKLRKNLSYQNQKLK